MSACATEKTHGEGGVVVATIQLQLQKNAAVVFFTS